MPWTACSPSSARRLPMGGCPAAGIRDLRHQKPAGPYGTQPEERRGRFDTGVHFTDVQGGEDAEGRRDSRSGIVTVRPKKAATGSASSRLNMDPARLLYGDGHYASCRGGAGKTEDSRRVDGWSATGLDAVSRMRQESHGRDALDLDHRPPPQFMVLEARRVSYQDAVRSALHPTAQCDQWK